MAITNLVLVVGTVTATQYKDAQFDLHRDGIPSRILRMTDGEWQLDLVYSAILDAAGTGNIDDFDYEEQDAEARQYLANSEDDEIIEPEDYDRTSGPALQALMDESQASFESEASRFPHTGTETPISIGSAFTVVLDRVVDLQAERVCSAQVAAAELVVNGYLVNEDTRVRAVVMSESAYHSELYGRVWFNLLPDDVRWYVARANGKVEIV